MRQMDLSMQSRIPGSERPPVLQKPLTILGEETQSKTGRDLFVLRSDRAMIREYPLCTFFKDANVRPV